MIVSALHLSEVVRRLLAVRVEFTYQFTEGLHVVSVPQAHAATLQTVVGQLRGNRA